MNRQHRYKTQLLPDTLFKYNQGDHIDDIYKH